MAKRRKHIPRQVEDAVLTESMRRCCLCYFLDNNKSERPGQIAHLDRNPTNNAPDNLVWLCFEHHDRYDSRTSQSKGLTPGEVSGYRDRLYRELKGLTPSESKPRLEQVSFVPSCLPNEMVSLSVDPEREYAVILRKEWEHNPGGLLGEREPEFECEIDGNVLRITDHKHLKWYYGIRIDYLVFPK
ncbi:MAG: hypothetical protein ACYTED_19605 [Planctomycetota bacterium]|jgi:hypothetical protein